MLGHVRRSTVGGRSQAGDDINPGQLKRGAVDVRKVASKQYEHLANAAANAAIAFEPGFSSAPLEPILDKPVRRN